MGLANGALALCWEVRMTMLWSVLSRRFLEPCQRFKVAGSWSHVSVFKDKCTTGRQGVWGMSWAQLDVWRVRSVCVASAVGCVRVCLCEELRVGRASAWVRHCLKFNEGG